MGCVRPSFDNVAGRWRVILARRDLAELNAQDYDGLVKLLDAVRSQLPVTGSRLPGGIESSGAIGGRTTELADVPGRRASRYMVAVF